MQGFPMVLRVTSIQSAPVQTGPCKFTDHLSFWKARSTPRCPLSADDKGGESILNYHFPKGFENVLLIFFN